MGFVPTHSDSHPLHRPPPRPPPPACSEGVRVLFARVHGVAAFSHGYLSGRYAAGDDDESAGLPRPTRPSDLRQGSRTPRGDSVVVPQRTLVAWGRSRRQNQRLDG